MSRVYFTKAELLKTRITWIRWLKRSFKSETDLVIRAQNFKDFKRYCRDRDFDAIAGYCETPSGKFYLP